MIRSPAYQKVLQDPIVTIRDGRFVVPVKAEHRGEVSRLVHDTSSSGLHRVCGAHAGGGGQQ